MSLEFGSVRGPSLPFSVCFHCILHYGKNQFLLVGGKQNGSISNETWILNFDGEVLHLEPGPVLNVGRRMMSCGKMKKIHETDIFVVAGGKDEMGKTLDSVELLNMSQNSVEYWYFGN